MCVVRHSAVRPQRLPPVRISRAGWKPYIDATGANNADSWLQEAEANENNPRKREGLRDTFTRFFRNIRSA